MRQYVTYLSKTIVIITLFFFLHSCKATRSCGKRADNVDYHIFDSLEFLMGRAIKYRTMDTNCHVLGIIVRGGALQSNRYDIEVLFSDNNCNKKSNVLEKIAYLFNNTNRAIVIKNIRYPISFIQEVDFLAWLSDDEKHKQEIDHYRATCMFIGFTVDMDRKKVLKMYE